MPTVRQVYTLEYVATLLGEDLEMLEAIVSNDDNLTYGSIINVSTGPDESFTSLTEDGATSRASWSRARATHPPNRTSSSKASSATKTSSIASRHKNRGNNRAVTTRHP